MIVEDMVLSGIPNYKKLDLNSWQIIRNDTVSRPMKRADH